MLRSIFSVVFVFAIIFTSFAVETSGDAGGGGSSGGGPKERHAWKKKDIRDYNEGDMEMLYDQWEEGDEPLEEDELPEYLRKGPTLDFANMDMSNPEGMLQMTKKGKTLMSFVSVTGNPTLDELEDITKLWQSSLLNNHIQADRFIVDEKRAIFMYKDGSQAWAAKDFLVEQERCEEVVIENKNYPGKYATKEPKKSGIGVTKEKTKKSKAREDL